MTKKKIVDGICAQDLVERFRLQFAVGFLCKFVETAKVTEMIMDGIRLTPVYDDNGKVVDLTYVVVRR